MSNDEKYLLEAVRTLRVIRILRVSRWESLENYLKIYSETVDYATTSLTMLVLVCFISVFVCAALTYAVEPEVFRDVFEAMYWCLVVQTTLGYGDIFPITPAGYVGTCVSVLVGLLNITFAINIMDSCFGEAYACFLESELERLSTTMKDLETSKVDKEDMVDLQMERARDKLRVHPILSTEDLEEDRAEAGGPGGGNTERGDTETFTEAFWPTGRTSDEAQLGQAVGSTPAAPAAGDARQPSPEAKEPDKKKEVEENQFPDLVADRKDLVVAALSVADALLNCESITDAKKLLSSSDVAQLADLRGLYSTEFLQNRL